MKKFILFSLLFSALDAFAQVAIIDDPDGYTNVRLEPNSNSEIIYVLKENEMFFYKSKSTKNNFTKVYIPNDNHIKDFETIDGYIQNSKISDLVKLDTLKTQDFSFNYIFPKYYDEEISIGSSPECFGHGINVGTCSMCV